MSSATEVMSDEQIEMLVGGAASRVAWYGATRVGAITRPLRLATRSDTLCGSS
ncbi:MAG TPA: hypothetical protein VHC43_03325 [Mycobacteriales bacterium]|nr:hypothetical protein [Mycobacteriales bacterium]